MYRCLSRCKRGQGACANNDLAREPIEAFAIQILRDEFLREERIRTRRTRPTMIFTRANRLRAIGILRFRCQSQGRP
jgi:hypothetical protein